MENKPTLCWVGRTYDKILPKHRLKNHHSPVYGILKQFADKDPDKIKLAHNLNKILTEDKELLERLAK